VLQGDTLKELGNDAYEIVTMLKAGDCDEAREGAEVLAERLASLLMHYESVLSKNGYPLPYAK
jgi:hypothetical protein